jgi:uncharacterized membrane protein (DUF2068 family)
MDKTKIKIDKNTTALALNVVLVVLGIIGFIRTITGLGYPAWEYYTQLSNYFALISAAIYVVFLIRNIKDKSKEIPKWVSILKYTSTLSLLVTFLVVVFILTPYYGKDIIIWIFFWGSNLFYHTLCPILTFISFTFFESHNIKGLKDNFRAIYFTLIYAAVFITLNILKVYEGPYPFLMVYKQPVYMSIVWFILIVGGAFGLGKLIMWIKNKQEKI